MTNKAPPAMPGADNSLPLCFIPAMARDCDTLAEAGQALYGAAWQSPLARDLGVAVRTMQRWAAGEFQIPDGVWAEISKICASRAGKLDRLAKKLAT